MSSDHLDPFADNDKQNEEQNTPENNAESAAEATPAEEATNPEVQKLSDELNSLKEQNAQLKDQMRRIQADAINLEKRKNKEVADAGKYAISGVLKDLLNVLDSFTQGLSHQPQSDEAKSILQGMQLTSDSLVKTLEKNGVEIVAPEAGANFDPNAHEAMTMQQDDNLPSGSVITVIQPGYILNGRVIRAARVIVNQ